MTLKKMRPTPLELTILRALWDNGPSSVREIAAILNRTKPTGYTTVLKMLQIMTEKGLVARDASRRPQIYRPRYSQEQTQKHLLGDLLQRAFDGSVKTLVMQALSTGKSSPEDLKAIEELLDRIEGESR
jgi:BlaI family penicillinase repressor